MDKSDITLERMRTFVRVAERGNLSAVARELGIGQSTVTRQLRELEEALGVPLLSRTTRRLHLTEEGAIYHAQCVNVLRLVEQANDEARNAGGSAAGTVRLSCTAALGIRHVAGMIFAFQDLYPHITIDLSLSDERIDLVREGFDMSLRLGPLSDSGLKLRPLGQSRRLLAASPAYLDRHGRPQTPEQLENHLGIRMSNVAGSDVLLLSDGQKDYSISLSGRLRIDHGLAAREALLAGRGITPTHHWLIDDLLETGKLEEILPRYAPPSVPLNMLIVPERAGIARVRLLADFLTERLRKVPGLER
ncbi:LysR family transcriptional regulator [Rhizobium panacihumi]|uniref:LysR family transcriptional regulator n=1 Tax=Rhizobium panacihumi TaxID=2008450 RepID=UPI003D790D43